MGKAKSFTEPRDYRGVFLYNKTPVRYLDTTVNRLSSNPVSTGVFSTILSYMLPVVDASQAYKIFS